MTTPVKKYRLLKDLPNVKSGVILTWNSTETWSNGPYVGGRYGVWDMPSDKSCTVIFTPDDVENNPEWFELLPTDKRIEVGVIFCDHEASVNNPSKVYSFLISKDFPKIPMEKFPSIKQAIEKILNDGDIEGDGKGSSIICRIQVGMTVRYKANTEKIGRIVSVSSFSFPENKVWLSGGEMFSINDFLSHIDCGNFEVMYYPKPLPANNPPTDKDTVKDKEHVEWEICSCWFGSGGIHKFRPDVCLGAKKEVSPCKIYSVKRKIDGEIFTIGDNVYETVTGKKDSWTIKEFSLKDTRCFSCGINIMNFEKSTPLTQSPIHSKEVDKGFMEAITKWKDTYCQPLDQWTEEMLMEWKGSGLNVHAFIKQQLPTPNN